MAQNKRTKGHIKINGVEKQGLTVVLYDQDTPPLLPRWSSELGKDTTDANGYYDISYSPDKYGGWLFDEDRIEGTARNPDLYIRVFQGDTLLKTSAIKHDVSTEEYSINIDLPANAQEEGEQSLSDNISNFFSDMESFFVNTAADLIEEGGDLVADGQDAILGEDSGDDTRHSSHVAAAHMRDYENNAHDHSGLATNRIEPIPDDLWNSLKTRYRNYKRDLLLRHFFAPNRDDHRQKYERAIPFLVSGENIIGKIHEDRAATCDGNGRYNGAEVYPLDYIEIDEDNIRENADRYARVYENGLAYNGAFIACLAHEYALVDSNNLSSVETPECYKNECETLISLALSAIQELHSHTGHTGYIIRYTEEGDCSDFIPEGRAICTHININIDDAIEINETIRNALRWRHSTLTISHLPVIQRLKNDEEIRLIKYNDGKVFQLRPMEDSDEYEIYKCNERYCGFKDLEEGSYCKKHPENGESRLRRYEPSGDEYTHLLEGLSLAYDILPTTSSVHTDIKNLIATIHSYLIENYYYLIRPCGNFTMRGPYMSTYELPLSYMFKHILGVELSDTSSVSMQGVLEKAKVKNFKISNGILYFDSPNDLYIKSNELDTLKIDLEILHNMKPEVRWIFVYKLFAKGNIDITLLDEMGIDTGPIKDKLAEIFANEDEDIKEYIKKGAYSLLQDWTLNMLAKASLIGGRTNSSIIDTENTDIELTFQDIYEEWFNSIGDIQVSSGKKVGDVWNPVTLAVRISFAGGGTSLIWKKLNEFFYSDIENTQYPVEHVFMEILEGTNGGFIGKEQVGEYSLMNAMWPIATIAHTLGKPLDASISDIDDESGTIKEMLTRATTLSNGC